MPDCPGCGVAYLDGESHTCTQRARSSLTVATVGFVLFWIVLSVAGAPVVRTVNYLFLMVAGLVRRLFS